MNEYEKAALEQQTYRKSSGELLSLNKKRILNMKREHNSERN